VTNSQKNKLHFRAHPLKLINRYVLFTSIAALSCWFLVILGCFTRWQNHCCEAALLQIEAREWGISQRGRDDLCFATPKSCKASWLLHWRERAAPCLWIHGKQFPCPCAIWQVHFINLYIVLFCRGNLVPFCSYYWLFKCKIFRPKWSKVAPGLAN